MDQGFQLFPVKASVQAHQIDALFFFLVGLTVFFTLLIFVLVVYMAIRYRRRFENQVGAVTGKHYGLEIAWTAIPLALVMYIFVWSAVLFIRLSNPPPNALEIHVLGKQWMWKVQHPEGAREIDELHVPLGQPVQLVMTSQDVIHSFFIPAFRVKQDVVPGRYTRLWFTATQLGEYHLFCTQYCGSQHSGMIGRVVVMEPAKYEAWLAGRHPTITSAESGAKLFSQYGCIVCHGERAPTLAGVFGSTVTLQDGSTVKADEAYLRESILDPAARLVAGYPPIMPTFRGQLTEEQILDLIQYIKSLQVTRQQDWTGQRLNEGQR